MRRLMAACVLTVAASSACVAAAPLPANESAPNIEVKLKDPKDTCNIRRTGKETILEIRSPKGISRAIVKRLGAQWPTSLVLRLRLEHLESFEAHHGKTSVAASVGWSDAGLRMRQWSLGNERAVINAGHPLFLPIRLLDREGRPATRPSDEGWFEIPLPSAFFEGNPETITIDWIDAYRN
ncbi:MAG: hypothetical protein U0744_19290 [Gemmataceae bacterium]